MHYSQLEGRPNYPLQELSKEIEIVLNNNNKGDLETILLDNPIVEFGEVFLINSSGSDVLGRTLPEEILIDQDDRSLRKQPVFTQKIKSNSGELFSLIFRFDLRTRPVWRLFKRFGLYWVFFATFVVIFSALND